MDSLSMQRADAVLVVQRARSSMAYQILLVFLIAAAGALGRAAFQFVPSVEPLTPLAIFAGFLFGPLAGATAGISGFYASNFLVWGGQGPWTLFQCLGAGAAGFIGGTFGFGVKKRWQLLAATFLGIVAYEVIVTGGMAAFMSLNVSFIALYFLTSLPFSLVHIGSSLGFSTMFYESKEALEKHGGRLIEQDITWFRRAARGSGEPGDALVPVLRSSRRWRDYTGNGAGGFWYIEQVRSAHDA